MEMYSFKEDRNDSYDSYEYDDVKSDQEIIMELRNKLLSREVADQADNLIRLTHPAVQDAWEKYQITLKLAQK